MSVIVVGLNHRTVPLETLERLTVAPERLPKALHDLHGRADVSEAVVLSTCNRTEIYARVERFHAGFGEVRDFLCQLGYLAPEDLSDHLYTYFDAAAVAHLFSVVSGIDSAVLGESEIIGQVRTAWEVASREGATGSELNMLFRHAVEVGKRVRTHTGIARHTASVSHAAVSLAAERLGTLEGRRVLVLGAGEMGEGMVVALAKSGVAEVLVANRTWDRAQDLAHRVGGRAIRLFDLPSALTEVDVLLTSTGATSVLVDHADLEPAVAARGGRELLIVDVAVPRDVEPAAGELPGVTLLDMDDLRAHAEVGRAERRREVGRVRNLIDEEVGRYRDALAARQVAPVVRALREHVEELRAAELARLGRGLGADEAAQLDALSRSLVAKLLHGPTVQLKAAGGTAKGERLSEALRDLFDLDL